MLTISEFLDIMDDERTRFPIKERTCLHINCGLCPVGLKGTGECHALIVEDHSVYEAANKLYEKYSLIKKLEWL